MNPAILKTNGVLSLMRTYTAADPTCPAMRIFLDGVDVSSGAMEIYGPVYPHVEMFGWAKIWIKPFLTDEGKPVLETTNGLVKWEPVAI